MLFRFRFLDCRLLVLSFFPSQLEDDEFRQGKRILTLGGFINRHSRESGNPYSLLPDS